MDKLIQLAQDKRVWVAVAVVVVLIMMFTGEPAST